MAIRIHLGDAAVSADLDFDTWEIHIRQIFEDVMGERLQWFDTNYPDLPIMRRTLMDPGSYQNIYAWYVDFHDIESATHYKLTYGYENEQ